MANNVSEQFNRIASEYDAKRRCFIPCFDEFYEGATNFIASSIKPPHLIADLGAGTGILSAYWFKHFPKAQYVLIDTAQKMLDVARKRFEGADNVHFVLADYAKDFDAISNDIKQADAIISALSIHHLTDSEKARLFEQIHSALSNGAKKHDGTKEHSGGVFVNYDQFCAESLEMNAKFSTYWEKRISQSSLSSDDIAKWQERRALDKECSVSAEIDMMRAKGFHGAQCIYQCQKFAVIAALSSEACKD